ncbi:MAG: hypothetical protein KGI50_08255 [Patescibacteria group bacterium]|nr:hypothetical protein [Patescibacteria group bacterium]
MSKLLNRLDREISFHREKNMDNYALFFEQIKAELIKAHDDTKRIDFLADESQHIANVQLPTEIVIRNLTSLRDAIDEAMRESKQDEQ